MACIIYMHYIYDRCEQSILWGSCELLDSM